METLELPLARVVGGKKPGLDVDTEARVGSSGLHGEVPVEGVHEAALGVAKPRPRHEDIRTVDLGGQVGILVA